MCCCDCDRDRHRERHRVQVGNAGRECSTRPRSTAARFLDVVTRGRKLLEALRHRRNGGKLEKKNFEKKAPVAGHDRSDIGVRWPDPPRCASEQAGGGHSKSPGSKFFRACRAQLASVVLYIGRHVLLRLRPWSTSGTTSGFDDSTRGTKIFAGRPRVRIARRKFATASGAML